MIGADRGAAGEWIDAMNDNAEPLERDDDDILDFDVSDEALESAASTTPMPAAAMSFPSAPTVSILIICCSND
jgi:hypothetical protein